MTQTVLVTRAEHQAAEFVEALGEAGFNVRHLAALAIDGADADSLRATYNPEPAPAIVIFVSANAVRFGYQALAWPKDAVIGAIGGATAAALTEKGADVTLRNREGSTSETLLHHPELDKDLSGQRVVIVRGNGGRELLADSLRERGAQVDYVEVYRREKPETATEAIEAERQALEGGEIDFVSVMSLATFENLLSLLGADALAHAEIVTPSRTVAAAAQTLQPPLPVALQDAPSPAATIATLKKRVAVEQDARTMNEENDAQEVTAAAESEAPAEPSSPVAAPKRRGGGLASLALLISLGALALSGYAVWRTLSADASPTTADNDDRRQRELLDLSNRVDQSRSARDELQSRVGNLGERVSDVNTRLSDIERSSRGSADIIESLPGRVENVEQAMAAMQGVAAGTRDQWLRAEAEYYLQLANAQLQLARNPALAAYGLTLADERIRELANPVYTPVRRALATEIQSLRAVGDYDHEGIALRLQSLAQTVETLPIRNDLRRPDADNTTNDADGEEATGIARGWAATKRVMGKAFTVRQTDESVAPLMSPEAAYFLRTNLALKLETARLALLRGEQTSFSRSLEDAATWIGEYFDPDAAAVKATLATLAELANEDLSVELPDISGSLILLRQQAALASGRPAESAGTPTFTDDGDEDPTE